MAASSASPPGVLRQSRAVEKFVLVPSGLDRYSSAVETRAMLPSSFRYVAAMDAASSGRSRGSDM